jgi:hypothetical protein
MSKTNLRRLAVALSAACLTALPAAAFKLGPHQQILQTAVGPRIDTTTFNEMLGTLLSGLGNQGSDRYQFDAFRHFDSAPSTTAVCARANDAWNRFYAEINGSVHPQNAPEYDQIAGITDARTSFGALTHALQDFYAHSNWVELYLAMGQQPPLATALFPTCVPAALPTGLETGYFDLAYGLGGCPNSPLNDAWFPPAGFGFCHETLNKDSDQTRHGREIIPGTNQTYHALAAQLAAAHTAILYDLVVSKLRVDWQTRFPQVRVDCLLDRVLVVDTPKPCRLAKLNFINDSQNGGTHLADGTVRVLGANGATIINKAVSKGSWPFPVVEVPQCLAGLTVQWEFNVDDSLITPTARKISGSSQVGGTACDADIHITPESTLNYLIRFTNADSKISAFTDLAVTVNSGQRLVDAGPVAAGTQVWINLGTCNTVADLDFIYKFIDPTDNTTPKTVSPSSAPYPAVAGCLDEYTVDLGAQIYP